MNLWDRLVVYEGQAVEHTPTRGLTSGFAEDEG